MEYKITSKYQNGDTLHTIIEFEYKGQILNADVSHFRPENIEQVLVSINNRIASEKAAIDAKEVVEAIEVPLNEIKQVSYIPPVVGVENPLAGYSVEELKVQIQVLTDEYNVIIENKQALDLQLAENSAKYDLLIAELATRVV